MRERRDDIISHIDSNASEATAVADDSRLLWSGDGPAYWLDPRKEGTTLAGGVVELGVGG